MKFVFGQEEYLVNQEVKKFLKSFSIKPSIYDELATIEMIITDIDTMPMLADQKVIIVKNHLIFSDDNESKKFLEQFKNIDLQNVNLLFVLTSKLNASNPLIKYLLSNAEVKEIKTINARQLPDIIRDIVYQNGGQITNGAIIRMLQKFPINLRLIINEVKKLLLENRQITEKQVEQSIDNYHSEDYFALSNAIVNADKNAIIKYYNEKITYGQNAIAIVGQIASTLNLSILVDSYKKQGLSSKEIASKLNIHIFRIKKANDLLINKSAKKIKQLVNNLANLEFNIKSGNVNNTRGLDWFILELIK